VSEIFPEVVLGKPVSFLDLPLVLLSAIICYLWRFSFHQLLDATEEIIAFSPDRSSEEFTHFLCAGDDDTRGLVSPDIKLSSR